MWRQSVLPLVLCLALPAAAQQHTLSPQQMRAAAAQAMAAGQPRAAGQLAEALLLRDPQDYDALLTGSRAARDLGSYAAARDLARRAWDQASDDRQRFAASMVMAQALSSAGNRTQAQLWLRRAMQTAPNDRLKAVAVRDFRYVRHRNPWSTQLSFNIAPVSNINNGSKREYGTYELPVFGTVQADLTGAAVALSGVEYLAGVATRYRFHNTDTAQGDVTFSLQHRTYSLSDEAEKLVPDMQGSDFALTSAQTGLAWRGLSGDRSRPFQISATIGQIWYGGDAYLRHLTLAGVQSLTLSPTVGLQAGLALRGQDALSPRTSDAQSWELSGSVTRRMENGTQLRLGLSLRDSSSDSAALEFREVTAEARLKLARPLLGTQIEMGLEVGRKSYPRTPLISGARDDMQVAANVTAVFSQMDYYGFVPEMTLRARRVESDYGQYDVEEIGLSLGLRSAF